MNKFNEQAKEIIKKIYGTLDMDFALRETEELYKREYGQTFASYKQSSEYLYSLLKREAFNPELYTFNADGKTAYQDKRLPIGWTATKGKLTVLNPWEGLKDPVIADFEKMPLSLIKHSVATPEGGIRTRIITESQLWAGEDPTGSLILLNTRPTNISAYLDLGALGIVSDYIVNADNFPDATYWANACTDATGWHTTAEDRDYIGFTVTPRIGKKLREVCSSSSVEVLVESDGRRYADTINGVTATLKGKTNKEFWLLAHLYEPFSIDNSTGVIGIVTILKAIRTLIEKGVLPKPECTVRLICAMELYGFAAMYEALGTEITDNVLGALNADAMPGIDSESYRMFYPPYSSPFFANSLMKSAMGIYEELYPATEYVKSAKDLLVDDCFLGDSTTGVPTIWMMNTAAENVMTHHNSVYTMAWVDREKLKRALSILGFVTAASVTNIIPIKDMLDNALCLANKLIANKTSEGLSDAALSFFRRGERDIILDFKKISDSPLIDEYANKIDGTYVEFDSTGTGKWQSYAKTIIPTRVEKGLPFDRIKAPKKKRKPLPDGVIYGPFGLVLSAMDGKKDLERIIREALWEQGEPINDAKFKEYTGAVFHLAEYGYLSVEEKNSLTKDDLVRALRELGVKRDDIVLLHSALSDCGHITGGEDALIDAFLECAGTLLTPSFTRPYIAFEGSVNKSTLFRPYDKTDASQIWTGTVPKVMLERGALRSAHATHSWCGFGDKAEACLKSHGLLDSPTGTTSPLDYARKNGGKIVMYGNIGGSLTFLHYLEDLAESDFLENAVVKVKGENGKITTHVIPKHLPGCRDFYGYDYDYKIMKRMRELGLNFKSVKFGIGNIYLFDMKEIYEYGMKAITEDPYITLCDDPSCRFCQKYRK